jgi:hypothetical protein
MLSIVYANALSSVTQSVKTDTEAIRGVTTEMHNEMKQSREHILAEIAQLRAEIAQIDTHMEIPIRTISAQI